MQFGTLAKLLPSQTALQKVGIKAFA